MKKVVLATGNPGKVAEMQDTLSSFGLEVVPQSDFDFPEAVEDGLTFVENALKKARHACRNTNLPAIADDSGLEVDALNGAPGIYSSRYASLDPENPTSVGEQSDDANNNKLLAALKGQTNRTARFQCVIVYMQHAEDPTPLICHGTWQGSIAQAAAGSNGFGYDPLFYVPEHQCHSAQLSAEQKQQLSHRAKALRDLQEKLTAAS